MLRREATGRKEGKPGNRMRKIRNCLAAEFEEETWVFSG